MIKCLLLLCAEGIVRDIGTNNVSVFNIFENIGAEALPVLFPRFAILFILVREETDPNQIDCTLSVDLADQHLLTRPMVIDFQQQLRVNNVVTVLGLALTVPGQLTVSLTHDDKLLGEYPVMVASRATAVTVPQSSGETNAS